MTIQNISNLNISAQSASGGATYIAASANVTIQAGGSLERPPIADMPIAGQQKNDIQLQNLVNNINKTLKQKDQNLEFSVDMDTKKLVVRLLDTETGNVIRQFPSEEMLAISRSIDRIQQGLLLDKKA